MNYYDSIFDDNSMSVMGSVYVSRIHSADRCFFLLFIDLIDEYSLIDVF